MRAVLFSALLGLFCAAQSAQACPVCLGATNATPSVAQQLSSSAAVVLARPGAAPREFAIVSIVKGRAAPGGSVRINLADMPAAGFSGNSLVALGQHPLLATWVPIAEVSPGKLEWLKRLAVLKRASEIDAEGWRLRVAMFAGELFDADPLVSANSAQELAAAPYEALRSLAGRIDAARLLADIGLRDNAARRPLYQLLLAVSGDPLAKDFIIQKARLIGESGQENAALFTAWLEVEPAAALARGSQILGDSNAPPALVAAIFAGLRIHGDGGALREQIVELYREVVAAAPDRIGYIANDMEAWRDWSMASRISAIAESSRVDDSARLLALGYVRAAADAARVVAQKR